MNEIKIVSYSISLLVIEYNSNEKLLQASKAGLDFTKIYIDYVLSWYEDKLDTVETNCNFLHTKIKSMQ